jgi:Na+-translocating ferredoxin:NAD+ oxidoreductase RnfG subunit
VALIAAFFGMIFGFILVSVFESIKVHIQNQEELQKQTLLLQEILETLNSEKLSDNGS